MPVLIGNTVHALPAPGATVTRCGAPIRQPGSNAGFAAAPTKARVTCPECLRIRRAEFVAGWGRAIAEGRIDTEEPDSSE